MTSHLLAPDASDETLDGRSETYPVGCLRTASRGPGFASPPRRPGPEVHPGHYQTTGNRVLTGMPSYSIEASAVHPFRPQRNRPPPHRIREECRHIARQAPEDDGGPGVRTSTRIGNTFPIKLLRQRLPANGAPQLTLRPDPPGPSGRLTPALRLARTPLSQLGSRGGLCVRCAYGS